jgi:hypothetical protein
MSSFTDLRKRWRSYWKGAPLEDHLSAIVKNVYAENTELRYANENMWLKYRLLACQLQQSARAHERKNKLIKRLRQLHPATGAVKADG